MTNPPKLEVVTSELDILSEEIAARQSTAKAADLGRLSADAVMATYESAETAIATLKEPLMKHTSNLGSSLLEMNALLREVSELVAKIHDAGHMASARVDAANAFAAEVRMMIDGFGKKVP